LWRGVRRCDVESQRCEGTERHARRNLTKNTMNNIARKRARNGRPSGPACEGTCARSGLVCSGCADFPENMALWKVRDGRPCFARRIFLRPLPDHLRKGSGTASPPPLTRRTYALTEIRPLTRPPARSAGLSQASPAGPPDACYPPYTLNRGTVPPGRVATAPPFPPTPTYVTRVD